MDLICKDCAKVFKFQSGLSRHLRTHIQLKIKCECGREFSRRDNLCRHQLMSTSCRALESASTSPSLPSNSSLKTSNHIRSKDNIQNSIATIKDDSAQTEKYDDCKSVSDDLVQCSDESYISDSSETIKNSKIDETS